MAEPSTRTAYAILGILPGSDGRAIIAAYRALARKHHPDHAGEVGTERMIQVNAAFERLRTPERRAEYDRQLERSGIPAPRSPSRGAPPAPDAGMATQAGPPSAPAAWRSEPDGTGGAGRPPGRPSGSVLGFGRHIGWSIGEIARVDPGYLGWLEDRREGRPYREEIDRTLRGTGQRAESAPPTDRTGRRRG